MVKKAVFVSGGGTNLQALIDQGIHIDLVLSSRSDAYALERAAKAGIPSVVCGRKQFSSQAEYDQAIVRILKENEIDMVILAGFLSILGEEVIKAYPERILNVHPSLIPSFCGKGYYGGVKVTGATVHLVNEIPDGGRILLQKAVYVQDGDTPEILQKRVMEEAEWILLPQAARMLEKQIEEEKSCRQ